VSVHVAHAASLHGSLAVPGDKSSSHRALLLSALAPGVSTVHGLSPGLDVAATSAIVVQLGARRHDEDGAAVIEGPEEGLHPSGADLDCANSGTTMRLVAGVSAAIEGEHTLVGDQSLSRRPMDRVAVPLTLMGARLRGQGERTTAPLHVRGSARLAHVDYRVPVASAQVKSAIMFAALRGDGPTTVHEDVRTRTTTEDMFARCGLQVTSADEGEGCVVRVSPGRPTPTTWRIPGDPSQAAFFAVLGAVHDCAVVEVTSIDASPQRIGFVEVLARMGAALALEPLGDGVRLVSQSSQLRGTEVFAREVPSLDEVPVLCVAAAAASGVSAFREMGELRVKESDRFAQSLALALALGCRVWEEGDDFFVEGLDSASAFAPFAFDAALDHRLVMASAVAGCAGNGCDISGADTVASSYPDFFVDLAALT
jgi:3-phosphoshikimate 1-carboxyvinyltransferase